MSNKGAESSKLQDAMSAASVPLSVIALYAASFQLIPPTRNSVGHLVLAVLGLGLLVLLLRWISREEPAVSLVSPAWLTITVLLIGLVVYQVWQTRSAYDYAASTDRQSQLRSEIETVIQKEGRAELTWFKHSTSGPPAALKLYLAPANQTGTRLSQLWGIIDFYRSKHEQQALDATGTVVVEKVTVGSTGQSATALTEEFWFQPLVDTRSGDRIKQPLAKESQYSQQRYFLIRAKGRWVIASETAPIAPGVQ